MLDDPTTQDRTALSWGAGRTRRREPRAVPLGPTPLQQVRAAVLAGCSAAAAWLAVLVAVAAVQGRTLLYPLGAVAALFRGHRALGVAPDVGTVSTGAALRGAVWLLFLAVALSCSFAWGTRRVRRPRALPLLGAGFAVLVLVVSVALLGDRGGRIMQARISTVDGLRDLGLVWVAVAHAVAGGVAGLGWQHRDRGRRTATSGPTVQQADPAR